MSEGHVGIRMPFSYCSTFQFFRTLQPTNPNILTFCQFVVLSTYQGELSVKHVVKKLSNGYCIRCHVNGIGKKRAAYGHLICKECGDKKAEQERMSWCVLTPHKQGPMFFTSEFARQAAQGINNKGGLVK